MRRIFAIFGRGRPNLDNRDRLNNEMPEIVKEDIDKIQIESFNCSNCY